MSTAATTILRLLDSDRPLSEAMCRVILDGCARSGGAMIDLSRTMVLVPGGRIVPAIERGLLRAASDEGVPLIAPAIVTPLMLAGRLVVPDRPVLSPLAARLSWREVLEASQAADDGFGARVAAVFGGALNGVQSIDARARMRIARRMQKLSSEVAAAMLTIEGVARHESVRDRADLGQKLDVLAEFAARRAALLTRLGVADRDDALREAVGDPVHREGHGSVHGGVHGGRLLSEGLDRVVVLLADPEPVQRALLARLRELGVRVEVCVHSTEAVDEDGFPITAAWERREFGEAVLPTGAIRMGDGPAESAREVIAAIRAMGARLGRAPAGDQLAIMAPDDQTRRELERALELAGSPASSAESRTFGASRIGSLLSRLAELVGQGTAESLASFVRHDDVATWLESRHGIVGAESTVTRYRAATLVGAWRDEVVRSVGGKPKVKDGFAALRAAVLELVSPLTAPSASTRSAREWARPIREVVRAIVGDDARGAFEGERAGSIRMLDRALSELAEVPAEFGTAIACDEVIALVLGEVGGKDIRGSGHTDGVSIVGWLDAGMADEGLLVLAGFADGQVPQGAPVDPVLPDELRRALGLPSGRRSAARDAWILDGMLARTAGRSRAGAETVFVVPRRTAEGDPLKPSRFLLRVPAAELPARVTHLFPSEAVPARVEAGGPESGAADFGNTPAVPGAAIESVRVTAFKTFIKCPYLFQLQIDPRLRLESCDERAVELDARGFGTLVHAALEGWGREEVAARRRTERADEIEASLLAHLDRHVAESHPASCAAALRVQVGIARSRLRRFAQLQAEQAKAGWRVHSVERSFMAKPFGGAVQAPRFPGAAVASAATDPTGPASPTCGGIYLTGRIDRVDVCDDDGRFRALDYKTSSAAESPTSVHMKIRGGKRARTVAWIDLQLPLYRVLLRSLPKPELVGASDLGYVNLAPSAEKSGFVFLAATEDDLAQAEELARAIVAEIRAGRFAPAARVPVRPDDPLAPIWGVGMRTDGSDEEQAAASDDDGGDE